MIMVAIISTELNGGKKPTIDKEIIMIKIHYEVFALNVYGSDVIECDTLTQAIEKAREWSKATDCEILIQEITTRNVDVFFNGFRVMNSPYINEGVQKND